MAKGRRYRFQIITTKLGAITDIPLVNLRHLSIYLYPLEVLLNAMLIVFLVVAAKIDRRNSIFHIHGAANIAPVIASSLLRIPTVWHFHETLKQFRSLVGIGKLCIAMTRHELITVTAEAVDVYRLKKAQTIHNPIDVDYWRPKTSANPEQRVDRPWRIVCTANINPLKGQDVLLKSLEDVPGPWTLHLIGAILETHTQYFRTLLDAAERLQQKKSLCNIHFLGWLNIDQVKEHLEMCDVFVLPSRDEACPIALLEAMAMGKICVASNVGGVGKIISDAALGYIVQPSRPNELTHALMEIGALDAKERLSMANKAKQQISSHFSLLEVAKKVDRIYQNLMSEIA